MLEFDGKELITPAVTPGSTTDEDKCFFGDNVSSRQLPNAIWYKKLHFPLATISFSILQVVFYLITNEEDKKRFRYEPNRQYQVWRFLTYMLIHENPFHLILNVITQTLFAIDLERNQGRLRVVLVYVTGGVAGALGASCVRSDAVVGASAGGYALLLSHIPHVLLNFDTIKYRLRRCLSVAIIVISDVTYNLIHSHTRRLPMISWGAHVVGAISGFFLALVLYRCAEDAGKPSTRSKTYHFFGSTCCTVTLLLLFLVNYQVRKCNPSGMRQTFVYVC